LLRQQAGLHVCGFGWEGIGINDMTKTAQAVAEAIVAGRDEATGQAEVKGVYF
jgi:oxygen-dependent protoporphyrinogen oxidase